jgi:hypothetical protein
VSHGLLSDSITADFGPSATFGRAFKPDADRLSAVKVKQRGIMKHLRIFLALGSLLFVAMAGSALAQGRYANTYSRNDVSNIIRSLEDSSDVFSRAFQNAGRASSSERRIVERFENAVDRLRRQFDNSDTWWRSRNDVQGIMNEARQVNTMMNNERFARRLEAQWASLRRDINKLADTFDLPGVAGGGWIGGGTGGGALVPPGRGVRGGNVPSWAVGTFYGRNPNSGDTITMNVDPNGSVSIYFGVGGPPTYATLNRQTLRVGEATSRVSRINNGMRTTRVDNGEIIDYFRDGPGQGQGTGWGNPGGGGNVPSWALGTFYGRNPQNGGRITFDIDANGTVAIRFDNGPPNYATLNGTTLNNQGIQSRVSRLNNGIRTTRLDNGEIIDYYRTFR